MTIPIEISQIQGASELEEWFGYWPSFHDAEVVRLHLNRKAPAPSSLVVHTWEMTKELDARGYYVLAKHVVVEFLMNEVVDLSLRGFSHQNVLFGLTIETTENGFRLNMDDNYGISGTIDAKQISIRLTPGKPTDS